MIEDSNLGHKYKKYIIYLCQMNTNFSIVMTIQMWIHARTSYNILHRNLRKVMNTFNKYPGSSSRLPQSTTLSMWLQCSDVEHGRNHLITGQWCEPSTSAREITIDVNDSKGTLVQSLECELMIWCQTFYRIYQSKVNNVNLCRERENLSLRHIDIKVLNLFLRLIMG